MNTNIQTFGTVSFYQSVIQCRVYRYQFEFVMNAFLKRQCGSRNSFEQTLVAFGSKKRTDHEYF